MRAEQIFRDQRGVALPMAMIVLVLLTTLMLAFAVLSQTEPVIAHNQMHAAQARAHAEAGFERAVWALNQGVVPPPTGSGAAGSLSNPLPNPVLPPYDGSEFVLNGASGGYRVVVSPGPVNPDTDRVITSTGWIPTDDPADPRTAHRRIQAIVNYSKPMGLNAGSPLMTRGDLGVGGASLIDGSTDTSCGNKKGAVAAGGVTIGGSSMVRGADGDPNVIEEGNDYLQNQTDPAVFEGVTLNSSNLKVLRELAKRNGTYYGPGYPNGTPASGTWTGDIAFDSTNKLKNGIVFIDTESGNDIPTNVSEQNPADFANVTINGNPFVSTAFTGWIVVNGSLAISGNMKINGVVYAVNDFTYNGTGTGQIEGLVVSQNIRDVSATTISTSDTITIGQSKVKFNCDLTKLPQQGFALLPGTYRECPGSDPLAPCL